MRGSTLFSAVLFFFLAPCANGGENVNVPAYFEPSAKADGGVRFQFQGSDSAVGISDQGIYFNLPSHTACLKFVDASPSRRMTGVHMQSGVSNYLVGNDRRRWRTDIPHYGRLRLTEVYPGIDVDFHASSGQLEFDFVVRPGADISRIKMRWDEVRNQALDRSGNLVASTKDGEITLKQPVVYQERDEGRSRVTAAYRMTADGGIRFKIGAHDPGRTLVIDPVVVYSTYTASTSYVTDLDSSAMSVDSAGAVYLAQNVVLPGALGPQTFQQIRLIKLDASGKLVFSTVVGGTRSDVARSMVAGFGAIYLSGRTASTDFPVINGIQTHLSPPAPGQYGSSADGFVMKLGLDGKTILYSTYFGGTYEDEVSSIAIDRAGALYGIVDTRSPDFPTTPGAYRTTPLSPTSFGALYQGDIVVFKLSPDGRLVYSTYFGGSNDDLTRGAPSIAVDGIGNVYFTGGSASADLPVTTGVFSPPLDTPSSTGQFRAFLAKLNVTGTRLIYCTYIGPGGPGGLAVDEAGRAHLGGTTGSRDLPTTPGAFIRNGLPTPILESQCSLALNRVGFATKFNSNATALIYSSYVSVNDNTVRSVALDGSGMLLLTGFADSTFPGQGAPCVGVHAYAAAMDPAGTTMQWKLFGGMSNDTGISVAVSPSGTVHVAGNTQSPDFPTTPGALQTTFSNATGQGFLASLDGFSLPRPCVTSAVTSTSPFPPAGGARPIIVTAPSDCTWFATSSMPFVRITRGSTGIGSGEIDFIVDPKAVSDTTMGAAFISVGSLMVPVVQSPASQDANPYDDVALSDPFRGYISLLARYVDLSTGPRTFGPNLPVTRRLMARAVILSLVGTESFPITAQPYFTDVPSSDADFRYIQKLGELGITAGCAADRFCPDVPVTRGQMAVFLSRSVLGDDFSASPNSYFHDVPTSNAFYRYIQKIRDWSITSGCSTSDYCPDDPILKGQLAVFLARAFFVAR